MEVAPPQHRLTWEADDHGNRVARVLFDAPVTELRITVSLKVQLAPEAPMPGLHARAEPLSDPVLAAYHEPVGPNPAMEQWLAGLLGGDALADDVPQRLCHAVAQRLGYRVRHEIGVQMPDESLALGTGSCRDSAWLLVAMLRSAGWAARFVSGYLIQHDAAGNATAHGPAQDLHDHSDQSPADTGLHAWCDVHHPRHGWLGLDATSGLPAGTGHVALACAPMPWQAAPVDGSVEPCHVDFSHRITVR